VLRLCFEATSVRRYGAKQPSGNSHHLRETVSSINIDRQSKHVFQRQCAGRERSLEMLGECSALAPSVYNAWAAMIRVDLSQSSQCVAFVSLDWWL